MPVSEFYLQFKVWYGVPLVNVLF